LVEAFFLQRFQGSCTAKMEMKVDQIGSGTAVFMVHTWYKGQSSRCSRRARTGNKKTTATPTHYSDAVFSPALIMFPGFTSY